MSDLINELADVIRRMRAADAVDDDATQDALRPRREDLIDRIVAAGCHDASQAPIFSAIASDAIRTALTDLRHPEEMLPLLRRALQATNELAQVAPASPQAEIVDYLLFGASKSPALA